MVLASDDGLSPTEVVTRLVMAIHHIVDASAAADQPSEPLNALLVQLIEQLALLPVMFANEKQPLTSEESLRLLVILWVLCERCSPLHSLHASVTTLCRAVRQYTESCAESLSYWVEMLVSTSTAKQQWSSLSVFMRNRKLSPTLVVLTAWVHHLRATIDKALSLHSSALRNTPLGERLFVAMDTAESFSFAVVLSSLSTVVRHYGVLTESEDSLGDLSRVRLAQWSLDLTFFLEEVRVLMCDAGRARRRDNERLRGAALSVEDYLSLIDTALTLTHNSSEEIIRILRWSKKTRNANEQEDQEMTHAQLAIDESALEEEPRRDPLELYCTGLTTLQALSKSQAATNQVVVGEAKLNIFRDELKAVNAAALSVAPEDEPLPIGWRALAAKSTTILSTFASLGATSHEKERVEKCIVEKPDNDDRLNAVQAEFQRIVAREYVSLSFDEWLTYIVKRFRFEMIVAEYPPLSDEQSKARIAISAELS